MKPFLKEAIREAYYIPPPDKKDTFIREYRKKTGYQKTGICSIIWKQAAYIRKYVWLLTFAVFGVAVIGLETDYSQTVLLIAAIMPYVSALALLETFRSSFYGMNELEKATRFSLKGILFARTAVIGIAHITMLLCLVLMIGKRESFGYLMTGAVITIPYLVSSIISMEIERTPYGRDHAYASIVVAAMVSGLVYVVSMSDQKIFSEAYHMGWIMLMFVLFAAAIMEYRKLYQTILITA